MLQGVPGSGFEDRELIDSFEQAIEFSHFRALEVLLSISIQERIQASLS
jgi:hypothetical protein